VPKAREGVLNHHFKKKSVRFKRVQSRLPIGRQMTLDKTGALDVKIEPVPWRLFAPSTFVLLGILTIKRLYLNKFQYYHFNSEVDIIVTANFLLDMGVEKLFDAAKLVDFS
jgi:hypothetical protein